jgi:hypothetical protein
MDNVQNCDSYINIPSSQVYTSKIGYQIRSLLVFGTLFLNGGIIIIIIIIIIILLAFAWG